jgi:NAD(P)H-hydrate epimerase
MPYPVLSVAQMRAWEEETWASGQTPDAVISHVGRAVAEQLLQLTAPKQRIVILAGKGNNGADARAAVSHILARSPILIEASDPGAALPRLREALAAKPSLVLDGLFGIGLDRPLGDEWVRLIETLNESRVPVAAVDIPSGLQADTGKPMPAAVHATWTLTVGAPKLGLLASEAAPFVGRLIVLPEIGLGPMPSWQTELQWTANDDFQGYPPRRDSQANKGDFGHAMLRSGSLGYHGAAVLSSRGAQRAHPGLITVEPQESVYWPVAAQTQSVMVRPWKPGQTLPAKTSALMVGPGMANPDQPGPFKDELQKDWLELPIPMVVDASALDWLPRDAGDPVSTRVITPHPGEAARLLEISTGQVQADRLAATRELSRRLGGCWVVLKGRHTLVGRREGPVTANGTGNPFLAQGGSGDLLAGFITGLLAQPGLATDPGKALRFAVWLHGLAADFLSANRPNWTVEDLAGQLGLRSSA